MRKSESSHTIDVIFVLTVACAFAASILMVLMLGVGVYGKIQESANKGWSDRVCLSYITAKVHSNDMAGQVEAGTFEDIPALYMYQEFDGVTYNTVLYAYEGWLMELFCEKGLLSPESGTPVLEIESVNFKNIKPNLLSVEYLDKDGNSGRAFINLRSGGGDTT